ncbi:unnamed protein product [Caenorhabditis angaria]|uniref:Uncharacterized protein n=1 Tax=Caenorhabditis angaria TaxID=860376 RepID=A0A9P1J1H9_9PELO|nr:unnamed protein product [Caenorhabditis angaria]
MSVSPVFIDGFCDSIYSQEGYFIVLRRFMEFSSIFNLLVVVFLSILLFIYGKSIKPDYRQVLLINLILPAIFSLYMGFIYQPYIIFPYHLLLTIGFFRFGPFVTAHLFNICCSIAILCSMGLIYSFWFNYMTICFRISRNASKKSNLMGFIFGIIFTFVNFILMTIGVNERQYEDYTDIINQDKRTQYFLENYSIAIVRVDQKWSLKVLSVEGFIGITCVVIIIPIITIKSYNALNLMHTQVSKTTVNQLKNALAISLCYLFQFGILVGIPAATAMAILLLRITPSPTFPLAFIILAPTQFTCPVICLLYICVLKPLRIGMLKILRLQKYLKQPIPPRSTQSQLSTVTTHHRLTSKGPFAASRLY